ncbi:hypothetical protein NP493_3651g00000 [Ridgeia piscesae]|uniref:Galaxin-like repeats domain-containing protein n=1 Tax=Ridgeia piscesae TaxID=27915 RepID=A0AAD9J4Y0_RIDPI|nr:hypothetical protein NP493_3651g00000 [Ridgeia piscesae]
MHIGKFVALGMMIALSANVDGFDLRNLLNQGPKPIFKKCNGQEFNFRTQLCCIDQLYPRVTGTDCCCGYKLLDTATEKCCHGFVIPFHEKCHANPLKPTKS